MGGWVVCLKVRQALAWLGCAINNPIVLIVDGWYRSLSLAGLAAAAPGGYGPPVCRTVYETAYTTDYEQQCDTVYKQACRTDYREECGVEYQTEYQTECQTEYHRQCSTSYQTEYTQQCNTKYKKVRTLQLIGLYNVHCKARPVHSLSVRLSLNRNFLLYQTWEIISMLF